MSAQPGNGNNTPPSTPISTPTTPTTSPQQTKDIEMSPISSPQSSPPPGSNSSSQLQKQPQGLHNDNIQALHDLQPSSHDPGSLDKTQQQILSHEQLLTKARNDLDEVLLLEKERNGVMLSHRETHITLWWRILLVSHPIVLAIMLVIWFVGWGGDVADQITDWTFDRSFFDVMVGVAVRFLCGMACVLSTRSDEKRIMWLHTLGYWVTATCLALNTGKLMILAWDVKFNHIFMAIVSIILSAWLLFAHQQLIPLDEDNWSDDEDEKEATEQRLKLHNEAKLQSEAISLRLKGQALEDHLVTEAKRMQSFEFVEKQILRSKIQHRHESKISSLQFLHFLRPYFWPKNTSFLYHIIVVLCFVLLAGSKACAIVSPLYIGYAVDKIVTDNVVPWNELLAYVFLALFGQLLKQLQNGIYLAVKQQAFIEISSGLLRHVLSLSHRFHHEKSMGKTIRAIDRGLASADNVVSYLFLLVLPSIGEAIAVFIVFYVKFKSGLLAAIIMIHLVAYAVVTVQLTILRKPLRKKALGADNKYHDIQSEALTNYDIVRSFATEEYEVERYTKAVVGFQRYAVGIQATLSILNSIQQVIMSSTLLCTFFVTSNDVVLGKLTIGAMSSVAGYVASLYAPLSFLGTVYDMSVAAVYDAAHVIRLLKVEPEIVDVENAETLVITEDPPVIEFKNVCFAYDPLAGRGVNNLNIKFSRSVAFVGSTGAGKSTITKLLLRFYEPQSGEILINGQNINHVTNKSLKDAICVIPQQTTMFNSTILENLLYGNRNATFEQVKLACRSANVADFIESLPRQYYTVVGERGLKVSGGEAQRLSIARAILRSLRTKEGETVPLNEDGSPVLKFSGIIIGDEYTSALDTKTERRVQRAFKQLENGTTSIIIAHRLSTCMHAETICVLDQGQIVEMGNHQTLLSTGGRYAEMWNAQFNENPDALVDDDEDRNSSSSLRITRLSQYPIINPMTGIQESDNEVSPAGNDNNSNNVADTNYNDIDISPSSSPTASADQSPNNSASDGQNNKSDGQNNKSDDQNNKSDDQNNK